jgi:hypothetical protein
MITMAACTLSFFNRVLIFFMHKSFCFKKKVDDLSQGDGVQKHEGFCDSYKGMGIVQNYVIFMVVSSPRPSIF